MVISALVWLYLARHMPLRRFGWFCFLTAAFVAVEVTFRKSLSEKIKQNRYLGILLELVLGAVFVAAFDWFTVWVYPGTR
jgi:hypothetical protein